VMELTPYLVWVILGVRTCSTPEDESLRRWDARMDECMQELKKVDGDHENQVQIRASSYDAEKHFFVGRMQRLRGRRGFLCGRKVKRASRVRVHVHPLLRPDRRVSVKRSLEPENRSNLQCSA
jgi:hypothetical protein